MIPFAAGFVCGVACSLGFAAYVAIYVYRER